MSSQAFSLGQAGRAAGEGWCVFVRAATHGECLVTAAGSLGATGAPAALMNAATIVAPEGAEEALRRFAARLRERRLPGRIAALSPAADAAGAAAAELGLPPGHGWPPLMYVRAADARRVEHDYAVWRVHDQTGVDDAAAVLADALGMPEAWWPGTFGADFPHLPGADLFAAGHHGRATAVVGTGRLGDVVCIAAAGTRQAHRRRGAASAAMSAAMDFHVRGGARLFVLHSAVDAEPLFRSLGFAVVDHPATWVVPAEDASADA